MRIFDRWKNGRVGAVGVFRHGFWIAAWALAAGVHAQPAPTAPSSSSTGSFTVTYTACSSCVHWLEERVGDAGQWQYLGQGAAVFTNKAPGIYYYRVGYLYIYDASGMSYASQPSYGPTATVRVGGGTPQVDSLERQLTYRFEVRRGDLNGDGRRDLFVNRTSGGTAGNGVLESVVLLQQSSGRFAARVPTASQKRTAAAWPTASVRLTLRDVNADGFADVVLRGVADAVGASAAMNQIVYSPAAVEAQPPLGVRSIDPSLRQFARDVHRYLADPQYFVDAAPYRSVTTTYFDIWCDYGYGYGDLAVLVEDCYWTPYTVTTVAQDFSVFNPSAVAIWNEEISIYSQVRTRTRGLDSIESTVEKVLSVPVGGWDLSGRRGEAGSLDERDYGRGFELFVSLLGIASAEAQEAPRRSGTVYVTGRRVIGWLPFMHTALEYNRSTVSAYDSDSRMLGNGRLVSEKNWSGDLPHLMMTLGTVSRSSTAASVYWSSILAADTRYRDNLPYSPAPRSGEGRYNSNGYTHGVIRATGGAPTVNMNRFTGGNVPVPSAVFD